MSVTILYKEHPPFPVMATPDGDDLWLTLDDLRSATGWEIRPEGVCREGQCVPIPEGREREFVRESPARFKCGRPCPVARTAGAPRRCPRRVVLRRGGPSPPRDAALAASARFQVARSRGPNALACQLPRQEDLPGLLDRKSTRLNSSHLVISYAVFCLKKKNKKSALDNITYRVCRRESAGNK